MRIANARLMLVTTLAGALMFTAGCPQTTTTTTTTTTEAPTTTVPTAGKAEMERVCSQCHGLKTPQGQEITPPGKGGPRPELKGQLLLVTPRDWTATVKRMKDTNKCPMTPEEEQSITAYMNAVYGKK